MKNKKSQPVGQSQQYNVFKMVHVPTGEVYYSKGIISQCPDANRFLNKNYRMSKTHKTPGNMMKKMRDTLQSEWGVQLIKSNVSKQEANTLKKSLINSDVKCDSVFMSK